MNTELTIERDTMKLTQAYKLDKTTAQGATINGQFITWDTLRAAAKQEDKDLAAIYADLLERAEKAEASRLVAEDWKTYGYPLRTGFGHQYAGQAVMRAWEIRRIQRTEPGSGHHVDARVAYIVTWDRSDNSYTREASPELPDYDAAMDWVSKHYGAWHDELGGERTASTWLYT